MAYLIFIILPILCLSLPEATAVNSLFRSCPKSCSCKQPWFMNGAFVDCSSRGLDSIPKEFPSNTVELDLSRNQFASIPYLRNLYRLKKLDVAKNRLDDAGVESILDATCDLEELTLTTNQLSRFPLGLPKSLIHLDMSENVISSLSCSLLSSLPPLHNLILSKNMIAVLTKDSFCPNFGRVPPISSGLRFLDLSCNNIRQMEEGAFRCFTQLERLNMSGNLLLILGKRDFLGLSTLIMVDFRDNAIMQVGDGTFTDMPSLDYLSLQRNQLTTVPRNLPPNLKFLDICGNAIAVIAEDPALLKIKHLIICRNPLICDCRLRWIRKHLIQSVEIDQNAEDCLLQQLISVDITDNPVQVAARCANPPTLAGKQLHHINEDRFFCCADPNKTCEDFSRCPKVTPKCPRIARRLSDRPIVRTDKIPPHTSSKTYWGKPSVNCECPTMPENSWATVNNNNRTSILVEWTIPSALAGTTVEVQFHIFGYRECKDSMKVPIEERRVLLSHLKSDTNYIVCVMPMQCPDTATPFLLNSCYEVHTDSLPFLHKFAQLLLGGYSSNMCVLSLIISFLLLSGFYLMYGQLRHVFTGKCAAPEKVVECSE